MRNFLLLTLCLKLVIAIKFCSNKYLPSGSCPSNAVDICDASGNYCVKTTHNIPLQYSVTGVNGCEQFQTGGHSSEECHGMHVGDSPSDSPSCYPVNRNYCECTPCTSHSDCTDRKAGDTYIEMQGLNPVASMKCGADWKI